MANTSLKLVGLDFDTLKSNLKEYLKRSDSPFKDVDFEGSNINYLLDILAYNTYINSFYLNMVASEMFLDSATLRDSIISHAKELNYLPRSYRSAEAKVSFSITPSSPMDILLIPKGTSFTTKISSDSYTFSTAESVVIIANNSGIFNVESLPVYEGYYVTDSFVYSSANSEQRFVLSNPTIDTRSLSVIVLENEGANSYSYTSARSFLDNEANSQIFFLQAAENDQYEIVFGDNIIGRVPQNGATILAEYRVCNGELPNGAAVFFSDGSIQGQSNISNILTTQPATGGGVNESIQSIKFNAPRSYQNQDRAVTASDYENILLANFTEIEAVSAYGGEDVNPPQYGIVYIALDTINSDGVTEINKARFADFIKKRSPVGITPVIVNPTFLNLEIDVTARYNTNVTTQNPQFIETLIRNTISTYNVEFLNGFKKTIRCSKLAEKINNTHSSILGIDLAVHPYFSISPTPKVKFNTTIDYGFELDTFYSLSTGTEDYIRSPVKAIYSSKFTQEGIKCVLQDDREGNISIYSITDTEVTAFIRQIGTVDYKSGLVKIEGLIIDEYEGNSIHIHANQKEKDITATKNTIIRIRDQDVDVHAVPVRE